VQIGPVGLKLIEEFEGLRLEAYQDSVGVWTIGYGTTSSAGVEVHQGLVITQKMAEQYLEDYINRAVIPSLEAAQAQRLKTGLWRTRLNENQVDALCSFGYNLGAGIFNPGYTIGRDIRTGQTKRKIADDMLMYDEAGGQVLAGLQRRRQAERALFLTPMRKRK